MAPQQAFKVVRSSLFLLLNLGLVVLLLITPGDIIHQSIDQDRRYNIISISVVFIATFIVVLVVYASRLYTNRTVLAGVPKRWIPIEKEDVGQSVWNMIQAGLLRSATIAYKARPRFLEGRGVDELKMPEPTSSPSTRVSRVDAVVSTSTSVGNAPWGQANHPGWSSPASYDIPNLQYSTVIEEIPNLIEAKAVSLSRQQNEEELAELLARRRGMSFRDYMLHLSSLHVLDPKHEAVQNLLRLYYKASYSTFPLKETEFREATAASAAVIQIMEQPSSGASSFRSSYPSSLRIKQVP